MPIVRELVSRPSADGTADPQSLAQLTREETAGFAALWA
jgi:hypothetical protein